MDILYLCILLFEFQIFLKRKRIDTEGNISSGQVSRYFRRHHSGIGACHIKVNIIIRCQGVYYFLPAFNFLNLIQKEIRSPNWNKLFFNTSVLGEIKADMILKNYEKILFLYL